MRKLILAATSVAVLAAPAVSMAAHSTVVPSRTITPYTAQYTDSYGPAADQFNIVGTHIVKVAKQPANSFVEDKFTVKITDPATGKPAPEFASFAGQTIAWPAGWASDSPSIWRSRDVDGCSHQRQGHRLHGRRHLPPRSTSSTAAGMRAGVERFRPVGYLPTTGSPT